MINLSFIIILILRLLLNNNNIIIYYFSISPIYWIYWFGNDRIEVRLGILPVVPY